MGTEKRNAWKQSEPADIWNARSFQKGPILKDSEIERTMVLSERMGSNGKSAKLEKEESGP
jgi:hypothetical protein